MKIYIVRFLTKSDSDGIISYHHTLEDAVKNCDLYRKQHPSFGFYVEEEEVEE
jgi:hypothetical protein